MSNENPILQHDQLKKLREPFPKDQVSTLPRKTKTGGVIHLSYVGHAALTNRLLDTDPMWTWEPLSMGSEGLPVMDNMGGMWIKLTVCGVTRLGYGHAGEKTGGDAIKEVIGDALRNAAMRFGAALDLWHKGDEPLYEEEKPASTSIGAVPTDALKAAEKGLASYESFYTALTTPQRKALAPHHDELKAIAKDAG